MALVDKMRHLGGFGKLSFERVAFDHFCGCLVPDGVVNWRYFNQPVPTLVFDEVVLSDRERRNDMRHTRRLQGPRRNALLSVLEDWAQADADNEVGTDEEIVLAPRTSEVGDSLAARGDSEDVAPQKRRDT
ncbi:hypothetical protein JCGZ_01756 [Jatropha curcas]|uniref:Uncharacterized protein n=1 Tax=Jatropha curcas TaxID=180498 RepID=A0A067JJE7_JATCU|nr:hypothetical protein JCGZ_01756 [Jatropha curcas]